MVKTLSRARVTFETHKEFRVKVRVRLTPVRHRSMRRAHMLETLSKGMLTLKISLQKP